MDDGEQNSDKIYFGIYRPTDLFLLLRINITCNAICIFLNRFKKCNHRIKVKKMY